MVPKYPRIFRNRFRFILVPKYFTTPGLYVLASIVEFATVSTIPVVNNLLVALLFGKTHFASNMGLVYSAFIVSVIVEPWNLYLDGERIRLGLDFRLWIRVRYALNDICYSHLVTFLKYLT